MGIKVMQCNAMQALKCCFHYNSNVKSIDLGNIPRKHFLTEVAFIAHLGVCNIICQKKATLGE